MVLGKFFPKGKKGAKAQDTSSPDHIEKRGAAPKPFPAGEDIETGTPPPDSAGVHAKERGAWRLPGVADPGPTIEPTHLGAPRAPPTPGGGGGKAYSRNLTPEEIIEEVGSADLRDVFAAVLERGLVLRCHTEFSCRDLKMWMKPGEPELRWKTLNSNSKIKIPHLAHSLDLDKLLFVQKGKRSKAFMMSPKSNESKEDHCLSLLWKGGSLDLECENRTVREAMAKGFNLLIAGEPVLYGAAEDDEGGGGGGGGGGDDEDEDEATRKMLQDMEEKDEEALEEAGGGLGGEGGSPGPIDEEQTENLLRHFVEALRIGVDVVSHNREYSREARLWVGEGRERLWWKSKRATALPHCANFEDVLLVEPGKKTTAFLNGRGQKAAEEHCFSLLMQGGKSLNLEVRDPIVRKALFEGFKLLIKAAKDGTLHLILGTSV